MIGRCLGAGGVVARAVTAGVAAVVLVAAGAPHVSAEGRPAVVAGQAKARAEGFSVKIQVSGSFTEGGVALGIVQGVAATDSHDEVGSAEGRAIDYGLIDALNREPTAECPDIVPLFDPATLPPITRVDSDQPDGSVPRPTTVRFAGWPAHGPEAGVQDAVAGPTPTATGTTRTPVVDGGFLQARDVVTEARSSVGPDGRRQAVATVTAGRLDLLGGLITFIRPRFEATSRAGAAGAGSFTYDSAIIAGNVRTPAIAGADLAGVTGFVEGLLSFVGFRIDWPVTTVVADPNPGGGATATERVVVSPLRLRIADMPIGRDLLGPVLGAFGPQLDEALDAYLSDPCANQSVRLIVDVARGFLAGSGEIGVSFGGVEVETNDRWVEPPTLFGPTPAPLAPTPTPFVVAPDPVALVLPSSGGSRGFVSADPGPAAVATDPAPVAAPAVAGTTQTRVAPRRVPLVPVTSRSEPGRAGGVAVWVGVGVLVAIVAIALGDRRVMGRSRRVV